MKILFIHGANLNILGQRGEEYGDFSYEFLQKALTAYCENLKVHPTFFISNHEGEIVERIQSSASENFDAIIINAGAYSHYSLAIADALAAQKTLKIEVHITNIHARNRHESVTAAACDGCICGLKIDGYFAAIDSIFRLKSQR